jgi:hypothetical protein
MPPDILTNPKPTEPMTMKTTTVIFREKPVSVSFSDDMTKLLPCELTRLYEGYEILYSEFIALVDSAACAIKQLEPA